MRIYLAIFLIFPTLIPSQIAFAQNSEPSLNRRLGMFSKPSVVRIKAACTGNYEYKNQPYDYFTEGAVGSGYFVNSNGYIVTNAHVVAAVKDGQDACKKRISEYIADKIKKKDKSVDEKDIQKKIYNSLNEGSENFKFYHHVLMPNTEEPFPFETKESGTSGGSQDVAIIKIEIKNAPVLKLGDSDTVQLLDNVLVIGYPTAADLGDELKAQSRYEASVIEGKVANTNKKLQDNSPVLQIDVQAAPGNSGSPVLNDQGEVIGMITFAGQDPNGGKLFPFAIRTSTIQEYIRRSGTVNEQGVIDRLYHEGLQLYWKQDYKGAKAKFEAVKGLFQQHSEIDELIRDSEQKIADTWDKTDYTPWLVAIGGFIAGTVAVLLFVNLRKRNSSNATEFPALANVTEESGIEQEAENPPLRIFAESVSNIYRPQTLMSIQTAYIELKNSQGVVRRLNLLEERYQIGRDPNWSNIDMSEPEWNIISWHHAVLKKERDNYRIYDGDGTKVSTNRILINHKPIDLQAGHLLKDGDQLKIGLDPENQVTLTYFNPVSKQSVVYPNNT